MKKIKYQNVKGTQDNIGKSAVIRRNVKRTIEETCEDYGCQPFETPILNYTELMASKYAGGAEILEEMYTLTDRGERDLALRYDLTIPFSKVIAMNPTIRMPFKRYEIGKVFRDGPIKTGRNREFIQADVDITGIKTQAAEAELMMLAADVFEKLKLDIMIQYNNRKLLGGVLEGFGVPEDMVATVVLSLDKVKKIGIVNVVKELMEKGVSTETVSLIEKLLINPDAMSLAYFQSEKVLKNEQTNEGIAELEELQEYLATLGINDQCEFNPFLARGLEIYTGTIYEVFLKDSSILSSSIGSGGRYDNAIGGLIGSGQRFPTVGISFGVDVVCTALDKMISSEDMKALVDVYIIPLGTEKEAMKLAQKLRKDDLKVEVEFGRKKVGKAMDRANKEGIRYVVVLGEDEVKMNKYIMKDMHTGNGVEVQYSF
ncbi:histidine--tRNA ligase [Jeotgalibacillus salarius]|uniref:Histidine--tRNA ligase n=1 Tax=Jeotgalibacillus salarius TaxID=546023 RepID=A0A4Y8LNR0_9BACL|nr:histidine--tRNA ligase [Jeotgalibacillus salarius]TFE04047.1 histidine--tRNA ligase [Jeotgalibacillus salarius]